MRAAEVETTRRAILDGGWGDRQRELDLYVHYSAAHVFVAESAAGAIVGTSLAMQHGQAGWVGLVFVAPALRGQGLGGALTEAALQKLGELGCRSMLLAATPLGRPIYLRLGFVDAGGYTVFAGQVSANPGSVSERSPRPPETVSAVRELVPADLAEVVRLDRRATGEDRGGLLEALVLRPTPGWVAGGPGAVRGFAFRTPWGFGPVVAFVPTDAQALLARSLGQPDAPITVTVPTENLAARAYLKSRGLEEQRALPRMLLGEAVAWQPDAIWAIVNFAIG
jgi:GNAT superfamily N-acetyltransferase